MRLAYVQALPAVNAGSFLHLKGFFQKCVIANRNTMLRAAIYTGKACGAIGNSRDVVHISSFGDFNL